MAHLLYMGEMIPAMLSAEYIQVQNQSPLVFTINITSWRMTKICLDYWVISNMHHNQHSSQHLGMEFPLQLAGVHSWHQASSPSSPFLQHAEATGKHSTCPQRHSPDRYEYPTKPPSDTSFFTCHIKTKHPFLHLNG